MTPFMFEKPTSVRGFLLAGVAAVAVLAPQGARAEGFDLSKFYLRGEAGYVFGGSANVDDPLFLGQDPDADADSGVVVDFDSGFLFGGGVGYQILENWRVELGADYERRDLSTTESLLLLDSGDVDVLAVMASFYRDFSLTIGDVEIKPFVGGGIGVARLSLNDLTPAFPNGTLEDEDDTNFAWTGSAGTAYQVTERLSLEFRYRYLDAGSFLVDTTFEQAEGDYRSHALMIGLRYFLGSPAAEPEPVRTVPQAVTPPPPPPKPQVVTRMVYFDFDASAIRPDAASTLDEVSAILLRSGQYDAVQIEAHADRAGPAGYNMKLSQRRADSVRRYLVDQKGIESNKVSVTWKGETDPAVPTPDGKIEAKNRRAVVVIRIR
ncbi:MAG: OmpA family protein [Alphaproteobacteria bacterium]